MYSGSCSSIKSLDQVTVAEKVETNLKNAADTDDDDDTCTDDSSSTYSTTEDSEDDIDSSDEEEQLKKDITGVDTCDNKLHVLNDNTNDHQHYNSQVMAVMHQRSYNASEVSRTEKHDTIITESKSSEHFVENANRNGEMKRDEAQRDVVYSPASAAQTIIESGEQGPERTIPMIIEKSDKYGENSISNSSISPTSDQKSESSLTLQDAKTIQEKFNATAAGAATASEIFRHLQATRGKKEVTTELAKILTVLQTTLKLEESDSSSTESSDTSSDSEEDEDTNTKNSSDINDTKHSQNLNLDEKSEIVKPSGDLDDKSSLSAPLGKPPIHPNIPLLQSKSANDMTTRVGPQIQNRIRELGAVKPGSGKEEMNILSKILVTLLCSCKSASASDELKKIIRQFKDAATEAADEVPEDLRPISGASHASSRASKSGKRRKKVRSRKSSATSSNSQSEAESLTNTLTPCNTDSKSSGTEDEGTNVENIQNKALSRSTSVPRSSNSTPVKTRLHFNVTVEDPPINSDMSESITKTGPDEADPNVTFTVSLPKRSSESPTKVPTDDSCKTGNIQQSAGSKANPEKQDDDDYEYEDDEWEWDEEEEEEDNSGVKDSTKASQDNVESTQGSKRNDSTSSSREISISDEKSAGENSAASSTVRKLFTDMECGAYNSDSLYSPGHQSGQSDVGTTSEQEQSLHESPANEKKDSDSEASTTEWSSGDEEEENGNGKIKVAKTSGKVTISSASDAQQPLLMTHLQETFNVLNGAYQIITGSIQEDDQVGSLKTQNSFQASETTSASITIDGTSNKSSLINKTNLAYVERTNDLKSQLADETHVEGSTVTNDTAINRNVDVVRNEHAASAINNKVGTTSRPHSRNMTSRPQSRQRMSRPSSKMASRPASRQSLKGKEGCDDEEEDWGDSDEWEYYYEDDEDYEEEEQNVVSEPKAQTPTNKIDLDDKPLTALKSIMHQAKETSVYKCESNEVQQQTHEQTRKAVQNSVAFEVVDKKETEFVSKKTSQTTVDTLSLYQVNKQTSAIEDPPVASRPVSRQRRLVQVSRPNSRTGDSRPGSRKGSRPPSRTCSRMSTRTPGLDGVLEENEDGYDDEDWEWEYYYENDELDDELDRLSPTLSTAATTRATSPFPGEDQGNGNIALERTKQVSQRSAMTQKVDANQKQSLPTGKIDPREVQVITPQVSNATELSATPSPRWEELQKICSMPSLNLDTALELVHSDSNILSPTKELSVALAAEYLGQSAEEIAATLPPRFSVQSQVGDDCVSDTASVNANKKKSKKKSKKHRDKEADGQENIEEKKKRHKKRKHPVNVKELVGKLDGRLFQDSETGTKMVMEENTAKSYIATAKKEATMNAENLQQNKHNELRSSSGFVDPMDAKGVGRVLSNGNASASKNSSQSARIIKDVNNPLEVKVVQGDSSTTVKMRQHSATQQSSSKSQLHQIISNNSPSSPASLGAKRKQIPKENKSRVSPSESSEAYGTGSSGSDETESQVTSNPDHGDERNNRNSKSRSNKQQSPSSKEASNDGSERHSRLFRLLLDSDYTDSEADSMPPSRQEPASNTLPRRSHRMSGNQEFETSDLESSGIERKHSFRSIKSSGNESGDSSVSGTNKVSPPSMRKDPGVKRYMSVGGLETCYENTGATFGGLQTTSLAGPAYPGAMPSYQQQMVPSSHPSLPSQHFAAQQQQIYQQQMQYHALQLQQQQQSAFPFTPSSSEVSTPSSPTNAFSSFHGPGGSPKLKTPGSNLSSSYASSGMEFEPTSPSNFRKSIGNVAGSNSSNTLFSSSADYSTMQHQSNQVIFFLF